MPPLEYSPVPVDHTFDELNVERSLLAVREGKSPGSDFNDLSIVVKIYDKNRRGFRRQDFYANNLLFYDVPNFSTWFDMNVTSFL